MNLSLTPHFPGLTYQCSTSVCTSTTVGDAWGEGGGSRLLYGAAIALCFEVAKTCTKWITGWKPPICLRTASYTAELDCLNLCITAIEIDVH